MKKYLLDTNICIFFLKGKYDLENKILKVGQSNCFVSEITIAEMYYGAYHSRQPMKHLSDVEKLCSLFQVIPISDTLKTYGKQKAILAQTGNLIDDFDLLIGSCAIFSNMIMVTDNVKHLKHFLGLEIENWIER